MPSMERSRLHSSHLGHSHLIIFLESVFSYGLELQGYSVNRL
jgi:hypothetical protein